MVEQSLLDQDRLAPAATNPVVGDVMRNEVVFCLPSNHLNVVAKLMADNDLSEIPVLIDRKPVGYVRSQEIIKGLVSGTVSIASSDFAMRPAVTEATVNSVIQSPALQVDKQQLLSEVIALMQQQGRQLALVMHENQTPVGMIGTREISAFLGKHHG